ncbi:MAG: XRE family transcriptional regulator [Cyclobacteriaceae bacterium]|jgi:transcriptional regulator with XRE-family HTH domain
MKQPKPLNELIRENRKRMGLTQDQFANRLDIKRSLVGAYEEGRAEPRLELLQKMANLFGISLEEFLGQEKDKLKRGGDVLVVTLDGSERQNIEYVPVKAAAGYLNGFGDPEFVKELPHFRLPMLGQGTYRAFEIKGDSMLPLTPGSIVVGEYVDDLRAVKSGRTYILVTKKDGIVYKRVFNYVKDTGHLFLVSDNRQYAPYQLPAEDVHEVWAAKAYISVQFPDPDEKPEMAVEELASTVLALQKELRELKASKAKP